MHREDLDGFRVSDLLRALEIGVEDHGEVTDEEAALLGDEDFRDALENAPPGVMDVRSWHYWHVVLGITPVPPFPKRRIVCDPA